MNARRLQRLVRRYLGPGTGAEDTYARWVAAERGGAGTDSSDASAEAERALYELFGHLPASRPRRGFADRVLAAAGVAPARAPVWDLRAFLQGATFSGWPGRAFVTFCLLLTGLATACLPTLVRVVRIHPGEILADLVGAFVVVIGHLPTVLTVGKVLAALGEAFYHVATAPPVLAAGLAALAVSTVALRGLAQLLAQERCSAHVLSAS